MSAPETTTQGAVQDSGITVRVESFVGPLDLLLHLCRTNEMDLSRLSLRTIIGLFLPDKDLNLLGKETADRGSTPCGENPHLLKSLTGQAYGHVLLGHKCRGRIWVQLFTYHTCSTYLTCRQA